MIPFSDRGLLLGDGLFETLLWRDGSLVDFDRHAERMERGCAALGLPAPDRDALALAATRALDEAGLTPVRAAVRLNWTAGSGGRGLDRPAEPAPRLFVLAFAAPAPAASVSLATVSVRRNEGSPLSRLKSLSYLDNVLARREAATSGADEALMLNTQGQVSCAAAANLFWFDGDRLLTPALDCGVLDGTVRARVLDWARGEGVQVEETRATYAALAAGSGLFLTNSLIGVQSIAALDGQTVAPHPLRDRLAASSW